jgi:transposase-like protein
MTIDPRIEHPRRQFTLKTGTVMEDSPLGLDKWLMAMWLVASNRNGISSWELHRAIGITQKSAWFLLHRIRLAMQDEHWGGKLAGEVECDETFIGGLARNMHKDRKQRAQKSGNRMADKTIAFGMVERGGTVRAKVVEDRGKAELHKHIKENVEAGSAIFTDELPSYMGLSEEYKHEIINHAVEYVNGNIHTNTMENFWSLLSHFTCSGIWMSNPSGITIGFQCPILTASVTSSARLSGSALPTTS